MRPSSRPLWREHQRCWTRKALTQVKRKAAKFWQWIYIDPYTLNLILAQRWQGFIDGRLNAP